MVKFKCGKTQVYEAIKNKDKLMEQWLSCKNSGKSKRVVSVEFEQVERDLYRFIHQLSVEKFAHLWTYYTNRGH